MSGGADGLDEARALIGREETLAGADEVSVNDVRRKLEAYCFACPLHDSESAARAHGYRTVVAPVAMTSLWALPAYWRPGEPSPWSPDVRDNAGGGAFREIPTPFHKAVNASQQWEFREPLYPGDRLTSARRLVEVTPRTTRLGVGVFLTFEATIRKQSGETVAISRNSVFRYHEQAAAAPATEKPEGAETPAQAPILNPEIDWSRQLRIAEVSAGDAVPPFGIWLTYQRIVMSTAADRMFAQIHHNREYARAQGLADIIFNTRGYEMLFEATLRRWIGLDGRVSRLGPFRMGRNSHPGDAVICRATVTGVDRATGLVGLDIKAESWRGIVAGGEAAVSLPPGQGHSSDT